MRRRWDGGGGGGKEGGQPVPPPRTRLWLPFWLPLFVGGLMKLPTISIGAELEGRASRRAGEPSHIRSVPACMWANHVFWGWLHGYFCIGRFALLKCGCIG